MNSVKKILYIVDTFETGGAERSLLDIAINNKEFESVFVTIYKGNTLLKLAKKNNLKVYCLNRQEKYAFSKVLKELIPIIEYEKPSLIHSTLFRSDLISRRLKSIFSIPLVSSLVSNSYNKERFQKKSLFGKLKLFCIQKVDAFTSKKVDYFVSNSNTIKNSNAKVLGLDLKKIYVIYRGRDKNNFSNISQNKVDDLKIELNISDKTFTLLNVSRLIQSKGQLELLKAIKDLLLTFPNLKLLIAGEGFYRSVLEQYIQENNLSAHVTLLGNREDVPVLLQLADAFVFPSHYEGLPGALIEAMMAKKTIICSDIPENKECVSDREALIFQKGNVAQLVQMIENVVHHPNAYDNLGENAKKVAIEKFSIEKVVAQYNSFYSSIVNASQP